jgi:hypothetical protein
MNAMHKALEHMREGEHAAALALLSQACELPAGAEYYEEAARILCHDDLEIDDKPCFSPADDGGCWVSAWVYVPAPMAEEGE